MDAGQAQFLHEPEGEPDGGFSLRRSGQARADGGDPLEQSEGPFPLEPGLPESIDDTLIRLSPDLAYCGGGGEKRDAEEGDGE
jgi:hypothetical protein